jgi:hypothetical protein
MYFTTKLRSRGYQGSSIERPSFVDGRKQHDVSRNPRKSDGHQRFGRGGGRYGEPHQRRYLGDRGGPRGRLYPDHAGLAIQKYDEAEALETIALFRELAEAMGE